MSNIRIPRSPAANHSCADYERIELMLRVGTLQKPISAASFHDVVPVCGCIEAGREHTFRIATAANVDR